MCGSSGRIVRKPKRDAKGANECGRGRQTSCSRRTQSDILIIRQSTTKVEGSGVGEKRKRENHFIYIAGLPDTVTDEELVEFVSKCGLIKKDPYTGMPLHLLLRLPRSRPIASTLSPLSPLALCSCPWWCFYESHDRGDQAIFRSACHVPRRVHARGMQWCNTIAQRVSILRSPSSMAPMLEVLQ